jgi:hypothetical protein
LLVVVCSVTLSRRMSDACTLLKDPEVCSSISTDEAIQLCYTFKVNAFFIAKETRLWVPPFAVYLLFLADNAGSFGRVE